VMGDLEYLRLQVDSPCRVLGQERLLGGVVEVAGEQHPDVPELEAEHDGVPVDRVGGAQGTRLEVKVGKRLTLFGLGEEGQPGYVPT
jgi:hypothetical protein